MSQLARQLSQLQTETRTGRGRASLLFHAREAEAHDLHAIYGIGCNGFAEILQGSPHVAEFSADLFSPTWKELDRDTQDAATNATINGRIAAFLRALAPQMLTRAAHKCLEYLIRRFKIHVYNVDAVMEAVLPYHDSAFFGRLVQILELASASRALGPGSSTVALWQFLSGCQSTGAPLTRDVLVRQCLKDTAVLRFICDAAVRVAGVAGELTVGAVGSAAAAAAAPPASTLRPPTALPAVTLFGITAVDALTAASTVSEPLVMTLLPTVLRGLKAAHAVEFQVAAGVVAAALCRRASFAVAPWDSLVRALCSGTAASAGSSCGEDAGHRAVVTLGAMFAGQASLQNWQGSPGPTSDPAGAEVAASGGGRKWLSTYLIPGRALATLLAVEGFPKALAEAAGRHDISAFLRCLASSCIAHVLAHPADAPAARAALARLPADAVRPLVPTLTRHLLSRYRIVWRAQQQQLPGGSPLQRTASLTSSPIADAAASLGDPASAVPDPAAAADALASLLRVLSQQHPDAVDAGLGVLAASAPRLRAGSGGPGGALAAAASWALDGGTALPAAAASAGAVAEADATAKWVAAVLCGTQQTQVVVALPPGTAMGAQSSDERAAELRLSLTLALSHASASVRLGGAHAVDDLAKTLLASDAAASSVSASIAKYHKGAPSASPAAGSASTSADFDIYVSIAKGLRQCLADSDASVAIAAVATHRRLLSGDAPIVAVTSGDSFEAVEALLQSGAQPAPGSRAGAVAEEASQTFDDDSDDAAAATDDEAVTPGAKLTERLLASLAVQLLRVVRRWAPLAVSAVYGESTLPQTSSVVGSSQVSAERFLLETRASAASQLVSDALELVAGGVFPALLRLPPSPHLSRLQISLAVEASALLLDMLPIGHEPFSDAVATASGTALDSAAKPGSYETKNERAVATDVRAVAIACAAYLGCASATLFPLFTLLHLSFGGKVRPALVFAWFACVRWPAPVMTHTLGCV